MIFELYETKIFHLCDSLEYLFNPLDINKIIGGIDFLFDAIYK